MTPAPLGIATHAPVGTSERAAALVVAPLAPLGETMQIDRVQANQYLAFAGFTVCFLFILAVIVLAFS
jgi:hypothetical protein